LESYIEQCASEFARQSPSVRRYVCFWHKADIARLGSNVCFWG